MTLRFSMVVWEAASGVVYETRAYTAQVPSVIADVESVGGQVLSTREEGN